MKSLEKIKSEARELFTRHPRETGETYLQHLVFTILTGLRLVFCGLVILIHGLLPFLCTKTASTHLEKIYVVLKKRIPKERREELDWEI